jgi:GNAT superfamily N-acetyltransferase
MLQIREAQQQDEAAWRNLWAAYLVFYEAEVSEEITARTWARMLDPASAISCTLAVQDNRIAGFAAYVVHEATWHLKPMCYLEDLFVAPEFRGAGVGRAIIRDLLERGATTGWSQLYWHTHRDNPARKLYDEFVLADDSVRYRLNVK